MVIFRDFGLEYEFDITLGDNGCDQTNVEIKGIDLSYNVDNDKITYNSADVNWTVDGPFSLYSVILRYRKVNEKLEYESATAFEGLEKCDADADGHNWQYEVTGDAHSGKGVWASYSFDEGRYVALNPDNWLLLPTMDLRGKALSFCARSKKKEFKDNFGVFFLPAGAERIPGNLVQLGVYTEIPDEWTAYAIDLSSLGEGQIVFRHFNSGDKWALYIDDVTIFDQNAVAHPEQYNWVDMPYVTDHPHHIFGLESGTKYEMQMRAEPAGWGESLFFTTAEPLVLENNADNSAVLADNQDYSGYVKLNGRTLYKDGSWNTLCLPFDLTLGGSILDGDDVELMTLSSSGFNAETGTLLLYFVNADEIEADEPYIKAGKPYIIKWPKPAGYESLPSAYDIVDPVFDNVTISNQVAQNIETDAVTFCGTFNPLQLEANDRTKLYLGADDTLYWPSAAMTINACRAYFQLNGISAGDPDSSNGARVFVLNFGDDEIAGISTNLTQGERTTSTSVWYSLDGRKLSGKPTQKGLYIHNGKVVVK